jgi:hypothetical protein
MRVKVVRTLTRQLCDAQSEFVKYRFLEAYVAAFKRPDMALPHGAETIGAEAPRQRRAQRAKGCVYAEGAGGSLDSGKRRRRAAVT